MPGSAKLFHPSPEKWSRRDANGCGDYISTFQETIGADPMPAEEKWQFELCAETRRPETTGHHPDWNKWRDFEAWRSHNQVFTGQTDDVNILIDRITAAGDEDSKSRFADSAQMAFRLGDGICIVKTVEEIPRFRNFQRHFEADGIRLKNPASICSVLTTLSVPVRVVRDMKIIGIDEDLVVPNKTLSVYEDAIFCWKGEKMWSGKKSWSLMLTDLISDPSALLWTLSRTETGFVGREPLF